LLGIERLVHEVVRPCVAALRRIVGVVTTREEENGHGRVTTTYLPAESVSIVGADESIDEHDAGLFAHPCECALRVRRSDDTKFVPAEGDLEDLSHRGAVIDDEQGLGHWGGSPRPRKESELDRIVGGQGLLVSSKLGEGSSGGPDAAVLKSVPVPSRRVSAQAPSVPLLVPPELARKPLDAVVRALFAVSWNDARARVRSGKVSVNGATRIEPLFRVQAGAEIVLAMHAPRVRPELLPNEAVVFVDAHLIVVDKPVGVSTVPYEDGEKGTLDERIRLWLSHNGPREGRGVRPTLGIVHRLDKETSGLIVFARTWLAKASLASQFRAHKTERRYLAIAHGCVASRTFRSHLVANRGDGLRGSHRGGPGRLGGQLAVTHVEAVEYLTSSTLIACVLETGRTHQIRIHLSEAGHPIVGERVYVRGRTGPLIPAPRLMLHAEQLGFEHPKTGVRVHWEREEPEDFKETLRRLRRSGAPEPNA
jgi:23S rRNA pseudouridine1911/1915/1917 synthase